MRKAEKSKKVVQKSVGLPTFLWERIEKECDTICVTQTAYLRAIVEEHFRRLDEYRKGKAE